MNLRKWTAIVIAAGLCLTLFACGNNGGGNQNDGGDDNTGGSGETVSFEAYIHEGNTFNFDLDPAQAVSYDEIRNAEFKDTLSLDNWDQYFEVKDVYREHMEYDDEGKETSTYMQGNTESMILKDDYYYVDNWSKNGVEFDIYVDGEETRTMYNDGITYDPVTEYIDEVRTYSGGDMMLILTDFVNSWDDVTVETYTGTLNSYEVESASGDLFLLPSSLVRFRPLEDGLYYFAGYGDPEHYFVIFIETDDEAIDPEKEYDGAVYIASPYGDPERYTGLKKVVVSELLRECLKNVNE